MPLKVRNRVIAVVRARWVGSGLRPKEAVEAGKQQTFEHLLPAARHEVDKGRARCLGRLAHSLRLGVASIEGTARFVASRPVTYSFETGQTPAAFTFGSGVVTNLAGRTSVIECLLSLRQFASRRRVRDRLFMRQALFSLGDNHAALGNGEACTTPISPSSSSAAARRAKTSTRCAAWRWTAVRRRPSNSATDRLRAAPGPCCSSRCRPRATASANPGARRATSRTAIGPHRPCATDDRPRP